MHSTVPGAGQLVTAGVDSVEHGWGLDQDAVQDMADRGTAWTPTIGALLAILDVPGLAPDRRHGCRRDAHGSPNCCPPGSPCRCWAGTDVTGSIPWEVALLARMGLQPEDALAATSVWPRRFLGATATGDIVTYHLDPRQDPDQPTGPPSWSAESG